MFYCKVVISLLFKTDKPIDAERYPGFRRPILVVLNKLVIFTAYRGCKTTGHQHGQNLNTNKTAHHDQERFGMLCEHSDKWLKTSLLEVRSYARTTWNVQWAVGIVATRVGKQLVA